MKYIFLLGLLVSSESWAVGDFQVSASYQNTCAIDIEGVKCWGSNDKDQTNVPPLRNPVQVTVGSDHACAIDIEGVKCWGRGWVHSVPELLSPRQVSVGRYHTCALDMDGKQCWGIDGLNRTISKEKNYVEVSVGYDHACVLDMKGVQCWGDNDHSQTNVPQLKKPIQVSAGNQYTCALDLEGVKCWGDNYYGQTNVPPLKNPTQVSAGGGHTCALDLEGVKCWGDNDHGQTNVPPLKNPTQVSAGDGHTCALDLEGVKCWGDNGLGQTNVPELVFDIIQYAADCMTSTRSEYTKTIHTLIRKEDLASATQYLEYLLVAPAILSTDSQIFTDKLIPIFLKEKSYLRTALGYSEIGDGLNEIPDTDKTRTLAITAIKSASLVGLNFLEPNMQTNLQNAIRAAGIAISSPMNNQKISDLVRQLDSLTAEKQKLKSSSKSTFLVDSMELAANWLRKKVK